MNNPKAVCGENSKMPSTWLVSNIAFRRKTPRQLPNLEYDLFLQSSYVVVNQLAASHGFEP